MCYVIQIFNSQWEQNVGVLFDTTPTTADTLEQLGTRGRDITKVLTSP